MFKRNCIRIFFIFLLTSIAYWVGFTPDLNMFSTLFTILSIFISIGLSTIISFDLSKIKNDFFYNKIQNNLKEVQNNFLIYFGITACGYIIYPKLLSLCKESSITIYNYEVLLSNLINSFMFSLMLFVTIYYMYNFYKLQSLKNEIDNELRNNTP